MNKNNILVIILRLFLISLFLFFFIKLEIEKKYKNNKINYKLLEIKHHKGGRGSYNIVLIEYNNLNYNVSITEDMKNKMNSNKKVKFYYNNKFDYIFSEWQLLINKRIIITSIIILLITFIPFNLIKKYLDKKYEKKHNLIK